MDTIPIETPTGWSDYELIDTGDESKLERFGKYLVNRPDPRILWRKNLPEPEWQKADAVYQRTSNTEGQWSIKKDPPTPWQISYDKLKFSLRPTEFKHMGVFPEQAINWRWLEKTINQRSLRVLNLFAYTGGATIAAALSGARVTHVDSVKNTIAWARENAALSQISSDKIRWIEDDAMKFVAREIKRGNTYEGIILDPPRFGRGPQGEVWKLAEDLPKLLSLCSELLTSRAQFILLNAYTADLSSLVFQHAIEDMIKSRGGTVTVSELTLKSTSDNRLLPSGISARWMK